MTALLLLHAAVALACAVVGDRQGSRVMLLGATAPAAGFGWLLAVAVGGGERYEQWSWASTLELTVPLRLDGLALLFGLIITGVGVAVLGYGVRYFADRRNGVGRLAAVLVLFAGAMLGLVLADNLLALYVAWELTTVCSFLLIGDDGRTSGQRRAALRALLVTTGAGFAMLLGLLLLGSAAGTFQISTLVADPPTNGTAVAAVVLILVGAFAKSAQVPFHPWLPVAMVAATPVSAYLHAAAMVKAGVYLVARLAPALAGLPPWQPLVAAVGVATMLLGGWLALTRTDLKILLAYGTVAQLGFLMVLVGAGTRTAALAGAAMLLAHALFKATLFLVVGIIDHQAGTRDLRELSGVGRASPGLLAVALVACLSMVGLPPTVGYLGKEAAFEAFVGPGPGHGWVLAGLAGGSALTVAYTLRFLWGAFADRPDRPPRMRRASTTALLPPAALALAGLALGAVPPVTDALAAGYADAYPAGAEPYHLALWHGIGWPLLLSLLTLAGGAILWSAGRPLATVYSRLPRPGGAQAAQDQLAGAVAATARWFTVRTQVGSLPAYLAVTLAAVVAGPGAVLLFWADPPDRLRLWDTPGQLVFGAVVVVGVVGVAAVQNRLTAVLLLSAVGYLVAGLFVVHGAPDLALVQVLVETLTLLVFVLVLRRAPPERRTSPAPLRSVRLAVAILFGALITGATLVTGAQSVPPAAVDDYFARAPELGAENVVNAVITEFRALDTVGEVTVVVVASTGIASLILVSSRTGGPPRPGRTRRRAHDGSRRGGSSDRAEDRSRGEAR